MAEVHGDNTYLGTSAMRATQSTMQLVTSILGFDIVELWTQESDGKLHCTYVHACEAVKKKYPDLITGHYPNHKKSHTLSPMLCEYARASGDQYHWRVLSEAESEKVKAAVGDVKSGAGICRMHPDLDLRAPFKTEMAYMLQGELIETEGGIVFIVGFSMDRIEYKPQKIKFISGLGYAIYVAAFDLDGDDEKDGAQENEKELDVKEFQPRPLLNPSLTSKTGSQENLGMGCWSHHSVSELNLAGLSNDHAAAAAATAAAGSNVSGSGSGNTPVQGGVGSNRVSFEGALTDSPMTGSHHSGNKNASSHTSQMVEQSLRTNPSPNLHVSELLLSSPIPKGSETPTPMALMLPPTWDPVDAFSFPVAEIPISVLVPDNLLMEHFEDVQHVADGSNANIFLAKMNNERVVIKMIKAEVQTDPVAVHEFDVEHGMLSRISHPNIIKLMGAGRIPRRFIVLEYLGGGTLNNILAQNQAKPGLAQRLFRRPTFTYANLLSKARDIAEALDFLHRRCHSGATIIHRDLKPDNVGFTNSGTLKLFDFGLCTCVRRRERLNEAYEMTGNTGSLRYMAPEVALRKPYTEKADVYSFGIMIWQMARDRVPFKGMSREEFMKTVVTGGDRPKLDKGWPVGFSTLLTASWHPDAQVRPTFEMLVHELNRLIDEQAGGSRIWARRGRSHLASSTGGSVTPISSTTERTDGHGGATIVRSPSPKAEKSSEKDNKQKKETHSTWF